MQGKRQEGLVGDVEVRHLWRQRQLQPLRWRRPEIGLCAIKRWECKQNDPSVESGVTRVTLRVTGHSSPTRPEGGRAHGDLHDMQR